MFPSSVARTFAVFENGVEQKIAYFATTDSPFSVVLLIDTSGSTQFRLDDIQNAAINFVDKLKPIDSVMVMSFDDRIDVLCKATTDRNVITKAIRRTRTGGGTRLYDAVEDILTKQLKTITGRKAVVLFTDGVDTTSHRASYDSTVRLAEESDAPIYSVDYDTSGAGSRSRICRAVAEQFSVCRCLARNSRHRRSNTRRLQKSRRIPARTLRQDRRSFLQWRLSIRNRAGVYVDRGGTRTAVQYRLLPFDSGQRG